MQLNKLPPVFIKALPVLKQLEAHGYQAYFVGGCVRDLLLKRPIHDIDITTNAYPAEVKQVFAKSIDTGIEHGTVTVLVNGESYEITTFRTESGYQDFRRPDHVEFVQNLSEDLKRRDFTVNALAMNSAGEIIDEFNGIQDLQQQLIRAVGNAEERFHEDALRMMRAVRFMSQLKFTIEAQTRQAISDNHHLLAKISVERIRDELVKLGLGPNSRQAFSLFLETGLSDECPGLNNQADKIAVFPKLTFGASTEDSFWAIICILLKLKNDEIRPFLRSWKNSNALVKTVEEVVELFDLILDIGPSQDQLFEYGFKILGTSIDVAHTLGIPVNSETLIDRFEALPIKDKSELAIDGKFLIAKGVKPGPKLGQIIADVLHQVVNGQVENSADAISEYLTKQAMI